MKTKTISALLLTTVACFGAEVIPTRIVTNVVIQPVGRPIREPDPVRRTVTITNKVLQAIYKGRTNFVVLEELGRKTNAPAKK